MNANNSDLINDGIYVKKGLLPAKSLNELNKELDYYFDSYSVNGSIASQFYGPTTSIFDHVHFLQSINIYELLVDIADVWLKLYPSFKNDNYILTRISFKEEVGETDGILWHTDQTSKLFRNIIFLEGGLKDSGQFRFMKKTHKMNTGIDFAMTEKQYQEYKYLEVCPDTHPGDIIFFDAKGFHSNFPRKNKRRSVILTWEKKRSHHSLSRYAIGVNQLSSKVLKNINYFKVDNYLFFDKKDYDYNPSSPLPIKNTFILLLKSINFHFIIRFKSSVVNIVFGRKSAYKGQFLRNDNDL